MKNRTTIKAIVLALVSVGIVSLPINPAFANPTDGKVVAGNAVINNESATKIGVVQTSNRAIVDWKSYSIGANEHVQYYQPSASAVTLNRVVGEDPSKILGRISANGQVFLVNPNGIYFGKGAQIDVAGLVATTHNIRNEDFMAGKFNFDIPGKPGASVINEGTIRIADTGIAAFVAPSVANRGVIVAKLGKVAMAAANGFTLDFHGDQLLTFLVGDEVAKTAFDVEGKQLTSFVESSGRIEAQGGYVLLTARAAENAIHGVINHSGVIEAQTVDQKNGEIILHAGKASLVVSGTLDASAPNGGNGGFIETSGGRVEITPFAQITTASPYGKTGNWLIDPTNFIIGTGGDITGAQLSGRLANSNIEIQTATTGIEDGDIFVNEAVSWSSSNKLTLTAQRHINVNSPIVASGVGSVKLRADSFGTGTGTVVFGGNGHVTVSGGNVDLYYNPVSYNDSSTKSEITTNPYSSKVTIGTGRVSAYMLVNNMTQLQNLELNSLGKYALGRNIDAAGNNFRSIPYFSGILDGQGYSVFNLTITSGYASFIYDGLSGATVKNLNLIDVNYNSGYSTGGVFGAASINNIIDNVHVTGNILSLNGDAGGLVGRSYGPVKIVDSSFSGNISSPGNIGGLIGSAGSGSLISKSWTTGSVQGGGSGATSGGLVGYMRDGNIQDSYSTMSVSGAFVGGLVGVINLNNAVLSRVYSTGTVNGSTSYAGGLIGADAAWNTVVQNSYWDTQSSGQNTSSGGVGKTTIQMKQAPTFQNWDFANTWAIQEGIAYPILQTQTQGSAQTPQILKPVVQLTADSSRLATQYRSADATTLFNALVFDRNLIQNDPSNAVWHALYQNGRATATQVEANRLWNVWDTYRNATASQILVALNQNVFTGNNSSAWTALASTNTANAASAYRAFTELPVYRSADSLGLFNALVDGKLTNIQTDLIWSGLYVNGVPSATQSVANSYWQTWSNYKSASVDTLVAAIKSNALIPVDTDPVWIAVRKTNAANVDAALKFLALSDCTASNSCSRTMPDSTPKVDAGFIFPSDLVAKLLALQLDEKYSKAISVDGRLDISKLSDSELDTLMIDVLKAGISGYYNNASIDDKYHSRIDSINSYMDPAIDRALDELNRAANLDYSESLDLAFSATMAPLMAVADIYSAGVVHGALGVTKAINKADNCTDAVRIISNYFKVANIGGAAGIPKGLLQEFAITADGLNSPITKVVLELVKQGITISTQIEPNSDQGRQLIDAIKSDKSGQDAIKNALGIGGDVLGDFLVGKASEKMNLGNLVGTLYIGPLIKIAAQAPAAIASYQQSMNQNSEEYKALQSALQTLTDIATENIPIAGGFIEYSHKLRDYSQGVDDKSAAVEELSNLRMASINAVLKQKRREKLTAVFDQINSY